jgi:hypothetical protein
MSNGQTVTRPAAPPLPATREAFVAQRKVKVKPTLNDRIEELHLALYENEDYQKYLEAVWDEQAVEGSLAADNYELAGMLRAEAARRNMAEVKDLKKATIAKALGVVLRRFGEDRPTRRHMVHGESVPHPFNNNGGDQQV